MAGTQVEHDPFATDKSKGVSVDYDPFAEVPAPSASMVQERAREGLLKKAPEPASIGGDRKPSKSRQDIGYGELGLATGITAAAGAALPKMLQKGGQALEKVAPALGVAGRFGQFSKLENILSKIGQFGQRAAPLVGGTPLTRGATGAASGAISEAAGQGYEMVDEPGFAAEAIRFVVGGLPVSAATTFVTGKAGKFLKRASKEVIDVSQANRAVIEQKTKAIDALRGAGAGPENYQRLFDQIKSGADTDIGLLYVKGAQLATQAEDFGKTLISDAEQRALGVSAQAQTTASDITRQFEQRLSQFKMSTESEAQTVLQRSRETAQGIRNAAAGKAKDQRDRMYQEASRIEQNTQNQVQDFLRESNKEVVRLRLLLTKTGRRMEQSKSYVKEAADKIGQPLTETEIGQAARAPTEVQFNNLKKTRAQQIAGSEKSIFDAAKGLEQQGQGYQTTQAYQNAVKELNALLINPETKKASITVPQLENQINSVLKALKGKEVSYTNEAGENLIKIIPGDFQSLEYLRRFLGDRASGVPAEGFDAISQDMAGTLKKTVQAIQDEFVAKGNQTKPWTDYLNRYREASIPINNYKSDLGKYLLGKTDWDASQYAADAAGIPASIFKSHGSVEAYRQLSGATDAEIDRIGRQFVANELFNQGEEAKKISRLEWLKFPPFNQLKNDVDALARAEELSGTKAQDLLGRVKKRGAEVLKKELGTEKPIQDILTAGATAREKAVTTPRKDIQATIEQGKKSATEALGLGQKQEKRLLGQIPIQERRLGTELRKQQKQIGTEAAKESGKIVSDAKKRASEAVALAKQQRSIPDAEAKALQDALDTLTETPKQAFEKIAFGNDPVGQLRKWSPYIKRTQQGIDDYVSGLMDGLATKVKGSPDAVVKEWNDVLGPAHVGAGLMSQSEANSIFQQLQQIQKISGGNPQKLSAMERVLVNLIRTSVYQGPALITRRIGE